MIFRTEMVKKCWMLKIENWMIFRTEMVKKCWMLKIENGMIFRTEMLKKEFVVEKFRIVLNNKTNSFR